MIDINVDLLLWSIIILIKKISATRANKFTESGIKNENISNQGLAEELHHPNIRKFKNRKVHLSFIDNFWDSDLVDK